MPQKISDDASLIKRSDDAYSIELFNQEESQRIATNIKELLGVIAKLGAKLPRPALVALLGTVFVGSIFVDTDLLQRSGTLWSIILDTQNLSLLLKSVSYGLGLLGVFKMSNLYRKADRASQSLDQDLIVRVTPDPRIEGLQSASILLNAKNLVLEDQVNSLQAKITEDQNFIHGLVGVIQDLSLLQGTSPKAQELLLQAIKHIDSHTVGALEAKKLPISEHPQFLTTEGSVVPTSVKQSLRVLDAPGRRWSKVFASKSELDSNSESEQTPNALSLASP